MQTNIYGRVTGSASSKYDLWLSCAINSQSINNNTSNVTLKLLLKRNDGYADSAYNLYDNRNTVRLVVGGEEKVKKYITIDTRNSVKTLLASWSGDVAHKEDGTLSLPVFAEFVMDNVTLTGGSVSGSLALTTIARKSTLSFASATVNPGGRISATINSKSSAFTHKITYSLGGKSQTLQLEKGVLSHTFTVPDDWIMELTGSARANINVSLTTYNGGVVIGAGAYTVAYIIPATDEYRPSFDISLLKQNIVPLSLEAYVQGISSVQVEPSALQFKYGASLSAVTITVGSVSIRKIPAVFPLSESGTLKVTVAVRDTRGLLTVKETTINVLPYSPPSVEIIDIYRCDGDGIIDRYGTNLCIKYKPSFTALQDTNVCTVTAQYKTKNDASYSLPVELKNGSHVVGEGNISVGNSYTVRICVGDSVTSSREVALRFVSSANIPFNIKSGGNGAAFGKFSERENELSVGWDLSVDGDLNVNGVVACQDLVVSLSELSSEVLGRARYYSCFNGCVLSLRFKVSSLTANERHVLGYISEYAPKMYTPLSAYVSTSSATQCSAGISYEDGAIAFCSSLSVPADSYVYVSGIYLNN